MSTTPTTKIMTGPDTFIIVNTEDYETFKFMEYVPKEVYEPKKEVIKEIQTPTEPVVTKKRSAVIED